MRTIHLLIAALADAVIQARGKDLKDSPEENSESSSLPSNNMDIKSNTKQSEEEE